jgi:cell division inhibitor SepF
MAVWRKFMVTLGLQDDDEYDQYEGYDYDDEAEPVAAPSPRERERERDVRVVETSPASHTPSAVRPIGRDRDEAPTLVAQRPAVIRTMPSTPSARVHVVEPAGFNDAQEVGDRLKSNQAVILNLQGLSRDLQRRLIDFSSGLAYAVGGSMERVADQVFLLKPTNVEVSQDEKERLQARGLYTS